MAIKIKHGLVDFQTKVTLSPFRGDPEEVNVTYAFFPVSQAREMSDKLTVSEFVREVVRHVDGLDADYSADALGELLDWNPAMGLQFITGFWQGLTAAREKT